VTGHTGGVAQAAIETSGLSRAFAGRPAVDELTFEVARGEVVALLGPNGAGKTTTIRLLNGVLRPDSGTSRVLGLDPAADGDAVRRRTGVLTEAAGLDDRLTLLENVVLPGRVRGMSRVAAERRALLMLERFDMADRAGQKAQGLSTGQRKRVALARALLHEPDVLFLDEPTSGLDPEATRDVVTLIATLAREHGRTVLLCTHFLAEAGRLCRRMAVLQQGRLQAYGRPEDLAARLWRGLNVELDLGGPADDRTLAILRDARGVISVDASPDGAVVCVEGRAAVPSLVANLVSREVPVYGAVPRPATVEEIYFALQEQEKVVL
jgi:ABC-2 type transport system ATP-binding protein